MSYMDKLMEKKTFKEKFNKEYEELTIKNKEEIMKFKRVYVAGSYNADNIIKALDNIKRGTQVCVDLLKKGYIPFCPWLDYNFHWYGDLTIDDYYRYSMGWLEVSDCIYVLRDSENSKGTLKEIIRARKLKISVLFESQDEL